MRLKLTIAYDGTHYCGWQVQTNALSIQAVIQKAIETIVRHPISLTGSSRTDSGVHALGQTAHFDTTISIDCDALRYSINSLLPSDIRILLLEKVPDHFHARYSATGKIYHYHLHLDRTSDPMTRLYRTPIYGSFDQKALQRAATQLIGTHDYASFANLRNQERLINDSTRTLSRLDMIEQQGGLRLEFEGDGFLYKMVRNITGTLLDIAAHRKTPDDIKIILQKKDRRQAGPAAPPQGLFLMEVKYSGIASKDS